MASGSRGRPSRGLRIKYDILDTTGEVIVDNEDNMAEGQVNDIDPAGVEREDERLSLANLAEGTNIQKEHVDHGRPVRGASLAGGAMLVSREEDGGTDGVFRTSVGVEVADHHKRERGSMGAPHRGLYGLMKWRRG